MEGKGRSTGNHLYPKHHPSQHTGTNNRTLAVWLSAQALSGARNYYRTTSSHTPTTLLVCPWHTWPPTSHPFLSSYQPGYSRHSYACSNEATSNTAAILGKIRRHRNSQRQYTRFTKHSGLYGHILRQHPPSPLQDWRLLGSHVSCAPQYVVFLAACCTHLWLCILRYTQLPKTAPPLLGSYRPGQHSYHR